jgi:hypothetical protein
MSWSKIREIIFDNVSSAVIQALLIGLNYRDVVRVGPLYIRFKKTCSLDEAGYDSFCRLIAIAGEIEWLTVRGELEPKLVHHWQETLRCSRINKIVFDQVTDTTLEQLLPPILSRSNYVRVKINSGQGEVLYPRRSIARHLNFGDARVANTKSPLPELTFTPPPRLPSPIAAIVAPSSGAQAAPIPLLCPIPMRPVPITACNLLHPVPMRALAAPAIAPDLSGAIAQLQLSPGKKFIQCHGLVFVKPIPTHRADIKVEIYDCAKRTREFIFLYRNSTLIEIRSIAKGTQITVELDRLIIEGHDDPVLFDAPPGQF